PATHFVTSTVPATAWPPSPLIRPTVSAAAASLISTHSTLAPSRAKAMAVALPLPQPGPIEPAPTTIATLSLRRSVMDCSYLRPRAGWPTVLRLATPGDRCREHSVCDAAPRVIRFARDFGKHRSNGGEHAL